MGIRGVVGRRQYCLSGFVRLVRVGGVFGRMFDKTRLTATGYLVASVIRALSMSARLAC